MSIRSEIENQTAEQKRIISTLKQLQFWYPHADISINKRYVLPSSNENPYWYYTISVSETFNPSLETQGYSFEEVCEKFEEAHMVKLRKKYGGGKLFAYFFKTISLRL
jgi:hypothetical protein